MKKLLLCAFVVVLCGVVQAGDNKAACTEQAKGCCAEKTACCAKVVKKADVSVKGATLLVRR